MTAPTEHLADAELEQLPWRLDPARSSVEFRVKTFWGLVTVKGHFERYAGRLDFGEDPVIDLTIDAASVNTDNAKRDAHLRSEDFFGAAEHPYVRFLSRETIRVGE